VRFSAEHLAQVDAGGIASPTVEPLRSLARCLVDNAERLTVVADPATARVSTERRMLVGDPWTATAMLPRHHNDSKGRLVGGDR
jgi:hypothetical protein